ncbi:MAG: MerR family transcriptional regulator [Bacteriovoracaceae bacterium]|jgi:Hg(II)-responsive transcriptional regulator|nr:MerR family transcriptional regulator [Bacteriovoracaceae bacterium]
MKNENETFTIGKLAERAGVNVETVRFYERKGLIQKPQNSIGYRKYPNSDAAKIKFIKKTQELGFTLKEAKELLELRVNKAAKCSSVKNKTDLKIKEVAEKINDLQKIKNTLIKLSESCSNKDVSVTECPIIESFEEIK